MVMITSVQNERVKYVRSLARRRTRQREGRFVVEGTRLVEEMIGAGLVPALVFYTDDWVAGADARLLLSELVMAGDGAWSVSEAIFAACSDVQSPQGVLAVVPCVQLQEQSGLVLILDKLRDPGNLGTVLRSAEAAGVGKVLLAPGSVDLYNPKVVRGAMGAHFRLPATHMEWPAIAEQVSGRMLWLADAAGETTYDAVDWTIPSALVVGGEATGPGREASDLANGRVCIPMAGGAESLNAAMAATVILFESARQRQAGLTCSGDGS
jgi:TrmH family RNA methyltransferase